MALRDGNLIREPNDMYDVMYLSYAAAYCNVVVGEKKWVNLIRRSGARISAALLTDVRDFPDVLTSIQSS